MSEVKLKPHYFELSLRSVSHGELNQECPIVREYAKTSGELTMKQMEFTKEAAVKIAAVVVDAMDKMSMPMQKIGVAELAAQMQKIGVAELAAQTEEMGADNSDVYKAKEVR
jgi:hypothetical protein